MKKILLGLFVVGVSLSFAADVKGIIQSIDQGKKTITINGMPIGVMPYTKIEQEACGVGWDTPKKFADLKVGDFVEIDLIYNNNMPIAEDIEIGCMQNRAY